MIKTNNFGTLNYEALEVGDKVAYVGQYNRDISNAKPAEVVKVTAKQVTVKFSDTESNTFMRESGKAVGERGSHYRSSYLTTIEKRDACKAQLEAQHVFQAKLQIAHDVIKGYLGYNCSTIRPEDKAKLVELVNSLTARNDN